MSTNSSRREFLKKTAASGIGLAIVPHIIPVSALGRGGYTPPSDRIVMAVIGAGSQGMGNARWFIQNPDVQFVAACDVDEERRLRAKSEFDSW